MFQSHIANNLQQIAVFLELAGLTLVVMDIFYKTLSEDLENAIDDIAFRLEDFPKKSTIWKIFLFSVFMFASGFILDIYANKNIPTQFFGLGLFLLFLFTLSIFMHFICRSISSIIDFLNDITDERALSGIGLILAGIGCLFEVYQVITLCLYDGCYWQPAFGAQNQPRHISPDLASY